MRLQTGPQGPVFLWGGMDGIFCGNKLLPQKNYDFHDFCHTTKRMNSGRYIHFGRIDTWQTNHYQSKI
jgi:hypothetical protein